jgi:hypothetical protein
MSIHPEEPLQVVVNTDGDGVTHFAEIISHQAKRSLQNVDNPGVLQLSRLHPSDGKLVPTRYDINDWPGIADDSIDASKAGHNVYIEARTVRSDVQGTRRGRLEDTGWVFALVIDSDTDKGKGWIPTVHPSMIVETSPGNHHYWLFLKDAITAAEAKSLGERIRASTGTDHDTGNPVQPYRVAGTINYPSPEKQKRGRTITSTEILQCNGDRLWTPEEIIAAFPLAERKKTNGGDTNGEHKEACNVPAELMKLVRDGVQEPHRSDQFYHTVAWLKELGWTVDGITTLLEQYPNGIAAKYSGRIRPEVERVYDKVKNEAPPEGGQRRGVGLGKNHAWPQPKPLPSGLLLVAAFEPEFLPDSIAPWTVDIAERMQVPLDFVGIPALVALGSTLGRKIGICPQQ